MTREEEMLKFAHDYSEQNYKGDNYEAYAEKEDIAKACIDSINWADSHPRKGLWDSEKVTEWLENHVREFKYYDSDFADGNIDVDGLIETLTKAMETES